MQGIIAAGGGLSVIEVVQSKFVSSTAPGTDLGLTFDQPITPGNSIIAVLSCVGPGTILEDIDNRGDLLEMVVATIGSRSASIYCLHNAVNSEVTANFSVGVTPAALLVLEVAGISGTGQDFGDEHAPPHGGDSSAASPEMFPGSAPNITIALGVWPADRYLSGPNNGFTRVEATGSDIYMEAAYRIQPESSISLKTIWTMSSDVDWATASVVFGA